METRRQAADRLALAGGDASGLKDYTAEPRGLRRMSSSPMGPLATVAMEQATRSIPIIFVDRERSSGARSSLPAWRTRAPTSPDFHSSTSLSSESRLNRALRQIAPNVNALSASCSDPADHPYYDDYLTSFATDKRIVPTVLVRAAVSSDGEIESEVAKLAAQPSGGLIVAPDTLTLTHRQAILASVAQHGVPAIHAYREAVVEGGLISYAPDSLDIFHRSAAYVDRILKGEKPADLPAQTPIKSRVRNQPQDRQGAGSYGAVDDANDRRRGD